MPYAFESMRTLFAEPDWNRKHHYETDPNDTWIHLSRDLHWFTENTKPGTALPTMLALRVMSGLGYTPWMVVDYMQFYLDSHPSADREALVGDHEFLLRVLETIASGLPWRTAHYARLCGEFTDADLHHWLDTLGAPLLESCARAGLTANELRHALNTGVAPDTDMLELLGGLNDYKTRD